MAKILIVEDNIELLELVADFFRSKGSFEVDAASDGNCALNLISGKDYDIAILDIMLPGANGFEVCKALRGKSKCPIVFLTALGNESNILKGYETGCDDYVVKPFSLKVLYAKCLALLSRTEVGRDRLLDLVWGIGFDGSDRVVDTHIKKLRKSLGSSGNAIRTVIGGGYKIL